MPSKWLKRAPNGIKLHIGAISRSDGSEMMEPCGTRWKKSGHIRADALESFHGSEVAIGGARGPLNGVKGPK